MLLMSERARGEDRDDAGGVRRSEGSRPELATKANSSVVDAPYDPCLSRRSAKIISGVIRRDLVTCGEPNAIMARDVLECPLKIFLSVRLIADKRMETECHDSTRLLAVLVKLIELINDHPAEVLAGLTLTDTL
jgi:hypothetical protein